MTTCLIDNTTHDSLDSLHKHLRKLKVKQEAYYVQYVARKDRFSGEPIPFKSVEQYLAAEFLGRDTLRRWIAANHSEGKTWAIDWLQSRRAARDLTYPPCQVELRSLLCPTIRYYDWIGGYNAICEQLGYTVRYNGALTPAAITSFSIIQDTREQRPLSFDVPVLRAKLNCGDYGLDLAHDRGVYIERKSLSDFVGTLCARKTRGDDSNLDRFARELIRAAEVGSYIVMVVECPLDTALTFQSSPECSHVKVHPDHIFKNLRDLFHAHPNFQAVFVSDRDEAARVTSQILAAGESVKRVDLQYAYESGAFAAVSPNP